MKFKDMPTLNNAFTSSAEMKHVIYGLKKILGIK